MKYLIPLAALTVGVFAQNTLAPIHHQEPLTPLGQNHQLQEHDSIPLKDPLYQQPVISQQWAVIDNGNYGEQVKPQPVNRDHRKINHDGRHHKPSDHNANGFRPEQNYLVDPIDGRREHPNGPLPGGPQDEDNWRQMDQHDQQKQGQGCKGHKKWKGRRFGHVLFFVLLAALSFCLVKKCVKKRKDQRRQQRQNQNPMNINMIDEQINTHYAEIQRLTEMKNNMQMQVPVEPIIYHHVYPQQMEMTGVSQGRMVNQNSYPINQHPNIQHQNIPVGRPVSFNNPYTHPQIYRGQQY